MKYSIDRLSSDSAYMQIYKQLRRDITEGLLPRGSRLPSKRLLAEELGVSLITVEHSYALLIDEGYAQSRQRSGYYVCFGDPTGVERALPAAPAEPATPARAPEDFPFSVLARTMRRVISEQDRLLLEKSPPCGLPQLRQAIATYLARSRGISVNPNQIIVGAGAEYLYSLVVQLLGRKRPYALENPCYDRIRQVYEANGARCQSLDMGEDGILSSRLWSSRAGVLHITPFNSYPSGITASASKRHEYAAWARERNSYIVEDDYDSEFSASSRQIETVFSLATERVIYLNTFSRTLAPSMRTAYMVLPGALLEEYQERLGFYSCTVPVFEQQVLAEFIDSGELERYINRRRRRQRQNQKAQLSPRQEAASLSEVKGEEPL